MNILLIFFALPIATIIISIALQKILKCPSLVAAIIFAFFLVITFIIDKLIFLVAAIIYAIISFITAAIFCFVCRVLKNNRDLRISCRERDINDDDCSCICISTRERDRDRCRDRDRERDRDCERDRDRERDRDCERDRDRDCERDRDRNRDRECDLSWNCNSANRRNGCFCGRFRIR